MQRLKWGYIYWIASTIMAASTGALLTATVTSNLELAMLGSELFFASLAGLLVALAFAWLNRARRIQTKADELDLERAKYNTALILLDAEAERAANANEAREHAMDEALAAARDALEKDHSEKLHAMAEEASNARAKEIKRAWLLGYEVGLAGLTEDEPHTGGILIPWPVPPVHGGRATSSGR